MVMIYSIIRMNCLTLVAIGRKLQTLITRSWWCNLRLGWSVYVTQPPGGIAPESFRHQGARRV